MSSPFALQQRLRTAELSHGNRALRFAAERRQRPGFVRPRTLIGDDGERFCVRRKSERRAACEPTGGVRNAGETLARVKIGEGTLRHHDAMLVRLEDVLDPHAEERGDAKCERQARIVLFVLERIHGLTRDFESVRELALRPVAFRAQHAKAVLHRKRYDAIAPPMPQSAIINGNTQM